MSSRTNPTLRVLQLAPRLCWPLNTGANLRNYHLGRVLSERALVTLLAFENDPPIRHDLQDVYRYVFGIHLEGPDSFVKRVRGAFGPMPLPLLNYTTRKMKHELMSIFTSQVFDIVQVESIQLMRYLPLIRATRKPPVVVLDWHTIESELIRQNGERVSSAFRRAYARRTAKLMSQCEREALDAFDAHLTVSEENADRLRELQPGARIFVIENGAGAGSSAESAPELVNDDWSEVGRRLFEIYQNLIKPPAARS